MNETDAKVYGILLFVMGICFFITIFGIIAYLLWR